VRRRQFIAGLGSATAWPFVARAQPSAPVIGYFTYTGPPPASERVAAFKRGLGEIGYVEGHSVAIEYWGAESRPECVSEVAANLARRRVDVIAALGSTTVALAVKAATPTIPIIFLVGSDPVQMGLVASLARPGGNMTGFTGITGEMTQKRLALLRQMSPAASSMALLVNSANPYSETETREFRAAAVALGVDVSIFEVRNPNEIEGAFSTLLQQSNAALVVSADPIFVRATKLMAMLAARYAVPTMYQYTDAVEAGGLMSYGPVLLDQYRQAGGYAGRILKGEKPADLPVVQPTKFELAINLKAAERLRLDIPEVLLATADRVIE
jgi:putative ABC transport system substrate-binding protein